MEPLAHRTIWYAFCVRKHTHIAMRRTQLLLVHTCSVVVSSSVNGYVPCRLYSIYLFPIQRPWITMWRANYWPLLVYAILGQGCVSRSMIVVRRDAFSTFPDQLNNDCCALHVLYLVSSRFWLDDFFLLFCVFGCYFCTRFILLVLLVCEC